MAIEDITMLRVLIGDLEKRIVTLEIEDKVDAVFDNGLMSRIGVLEKRIGSLEKFGNDGGVGFKSRMEAVESRLDGYIQCHASGHEAIDYRLDVFDSKVDSLENRFKAHVVFGN